MSQEQPGSVVAANWLLGALLAVQGIAALLTVVFDDRLIDSWTAAHDDGGAVEPPAFVAVALVMFIVVASLALVLLAFFRGRHGWARTGLTVLLTGVLLGTIGLMLTAPPLLFQALLGFSLVVAVAELAALWQRDTTAYLRHLG